jgi:hypothetical protein
MSIRRTFGTKDCGVITREQFVFVFDALMCLLPLPGEAAPVQTDRTKENRRMRRAWITLAILCPWIIGLWLVF